MGHLDGADEIFVNHDEDGSSVSKRYLRLPESVRRVVKIAMYVAAAALAVEMCSCQRCTDDVSEGVQKQIKKVLVVDPQDFIK
jgi:hypothetical protein